MLRGEGKIEQLAGEMKQYRLAILAVTETCQGEIVMDGETDHKLLFFKRPDGS